MDRSSKADFLAKTRAIRRPDLTPSPGPLRIALEARMLFDGAAIATAIRQLGPDAANASPVHAAHHGEATPGAAAHAEADAQETHAGGMHADATAARHDGGNDTGNDGHRGALQDALASLPPVDTSDSSAAAAHTVVFIDASLAHVDELIAAVPKGAQIVMLDPTRDGLQQVVDALAGRTDIDALHFLTHGNVGEIEIGNTVLNTASITADKDGLLAEIGKHLSAGADVLVYGCDFGEGAEGMAAMQALSHALGADIAASDNATGSTALHGDWVLEEHVGAIHTHAIDAAAWDGLLLGLPIVATPDVAVVQINGSVDINAVVNDIDLNNSAIALTGATALHGTVTINANNTLHYTPTAGYFGLDTISYTVRDAVGATSALPGLVAVTINPLSLPTLAVFQEDTPIVFASVLGTQLSLGDLNGSLAHLTLSVPNGGLSLPTTAGVSLSQGTGTNDSTVTIDGPVASVNAALNGLIYTAAPDYNGPVNLTLALPNLLGITVTTVLPISIAPVADIVPDFVHTLPNQSANFNVLANDTFENPARVVSSHTNPTHGTLSINAQGQSTYTPTAGYSGTDSFTYTVTSSGTTETTTVSILVGNHAPTATTIAAQSFNDAQTVSLAAGAAFSDVDNDALTYSATGLPSGLSINATTGQISGTVGGHASVAVAGGNYAVVVTANDGFGGSVSSSFQIHVTNPAPIAIDDGAVGVNTTVVVGNVLLNDHDPDGDALTVSTTPVVAPQHGTLVLNADGSYVYTPSPVFVGTDSFVYRVNDTDGGSATATVSIVVAAPVNHLPLAVADLAFVNAGSSVVVNVLANDTDADGDALTVTGATALHGTVTRNADGTVTYTPTVGFSGVDTITYQIQDSHGAAALLPGTVAVTVNAAPTLTLPNLNPLYEDTPIVFASVLGTQISIGDLDGNFAKVTLSVPLGSLSLHGTTGLTLSQGTGTSDTTVTFQGTIAAVNAALNGLVYTPAPDYNGPVTLTIGLTDGFINIPITTQLPLNIQPVADIVPDSVSTTTGHNVTFNVLANDTFENPARVVSSYTTPSHGSVTIDAQGNASYTPVAGYNGTDTFNYTVTSSGTTETTSVTVTIAAPANHAPTATTIADVNANDAQTVNIAVAGAFSDADGDTLSYTATGLPAGLSINAATGVVTGTLGGHASVAVPGGVYTVQVTADDGHGGTVSQSFHLDVSNPAPIAVNDSGSGLNNGVVTGNVLTNDSDPDGDTLTVVTTPVVAPTHGSVVLNANGSYTYTPTAGFVGSDSFTYRLNDTDGGSATAVVSLTITAPNHAPVANPDVAFVNANQSVTVNVLANDTDPDGDALTVTGASAAHGTVAVNPNGTLAYTPNANFYGADTITYTLADSHGLASAQPGTVAVSVNATPLIQIPTIPVFNEDTPLVFASVNGTQISVGNVLGNVANVTLSVPIGSLTLSQTTGLSFSQGTGTNDSTVTFQGTTAAVNAALNGLVYTPGADYNGPLTFSIGVTDNVAHLPSNATLLLSIAPVADIVADSVTTTTGHNVTFNVLANDTFENPGRVVSSFTAPSHGTVTIDAQGNASYNPTAGYTGTDTFNYTVTSNGTTETAAVTVTINAPVNHAPTATSIGDVAANDAQAVNINVRGAFSDADGDTLSFSATGLPAGLVINAATGVVTGTLDGHASQAVAGGVYNVVVSADDGHGGTVSQTFHLNVSNPAPNANDDNAVGFNTAVVYGNVLNNDSDPDGDALHVNTTPVVGPAHGSLVLNANGSYAYTPAAGFVGTDSFVYQLVDADGGTATATVHIAVATPINNLPIAAADTAFVNAGGSTTINVLGNDSDPQGLALSVSHASALHGTVTTNPDGTLNYTPTAGFSGTDVITYGLRDSAGNNAAIDGTVAVTVNALPTLNLPTLNVLYEDTPVVFSSGLGTQISVGDIDGNVAQVSLSVPLGKLTLGQTTGLSFSQGTGTNDTTVTFRGTIADVNAALNGLVYTPGADYNGPVTLTIGLTDTLLNTPITTQLPLNITPVADIVADSVTTVSGHSVGFNVLANDTFENPGRVVSGFTSPSHGTVSIDAQGNAIYNPTTGFAGTDTFDYTVTSNGTTETTTVTVTVNHTPPTATAIADVAANDAQTISIATASSFHDADGNTLTYSAAGLPAGLTINTTTGVIGGTLGGHDSVAVAGGVYNVTVTANDGQGGTVDQTFRITVANPAPIAVDDSGSGNEGGSIAGNVLTNDHDPDGDALTAGTTPVTAPVHGTVVINADGSYVYTPQANYAGSDSFVYRVTDADGGTATATVTLTIAAIDHAPTSTPLADQNNAVGTAVTVSEASHFSDVDGDALIYSATGLPPGLSIDAHTGVISGTLTTVGSYHVSVTGTDPSGLATSQSFDWTATAAVNNNGGPAVATPLPADSGNDASPVTIVTASGFSDANGDPLAYSATGLPGGLSINATTGVISGTLDGHASVGGTNGVYTIVVTAADGHGGSVAQGFTFTAVNPAPVAVDDTATGLEGGVVAGNVITNDHDPDGDALTVATTPIVAPGHGTLVLNADGSYVYTPQANFTGTDTFTYRLVDADGGTAAATVTLTVYPVYPVDHAPDTVGTLPAGAGNDASAVSIATAGGFHDQDGDPLTYGATGLPAGLSINATTGVISGTLDGHASVGGANGVYTISVTANDGHGGAAVQTFRFTASNPAPIAVADTASGLEDGTISGNVLVNDRDPDGDALHVAAAPVVAPTHGTVVINADGSYVYTPQANFNGTDSFTYRLVDADGGTATATVTLTVAAVNDAPTATPLADQTNAVGTSVAVAEGASFHDVDGDPLTFTASGLPPGLSIDAHTGVISGTLTTVGTYHVTVTGTDPSGLAASSSFDWSATVGAAGGPVTVGTIPPVNADDASSVVIPTAPAFNDPAGVPLTYTATGLPTGVTIDPSTGVISGTLDGHASTEAPGGVYTVVVTASDGHGGTASVGLTITASDVAPIAPTGVGPVTTTGPIGGNLLTGVVDPDGDALRVDLAPVVAPGHGTVVVAANGAYVYTPQAGYVGADSFTFNVVDTDGKGTQVTVNVTVQTGAATLAPTRPVATDPALPERLEPTASATPFDTPMPVVGGPVALLANATGTADEEESVLDTTTQQEATLHAAEPVILKAVNEVKQLLGNAGLAAKTPLLASVNAFSELGGNTEIVEGAHPMSQVVGDLNTGFRTPLVVGSAFDATGAVAPVLVAAYPADSTVGALPAAGAVALATYDKESVGQTLNFRSDQPIVQLTAQLRVASLGAQHELAALAEAMN